MPFSKDKADLKRRFGDNPDAIAQYLTEAFAKNELAPVLKALSEIVRGQNVKALARKTGMGREGLHRSFAGEVQPDLGRLLGLLAVLNVQLVAVPKVSKIATTRPKLSRPRKSTSESKAQSKRSRSALSERPVKALAGTSNSSSTGKR
jgi:probable addiction module antidote protein